MLILLIIFFKNALLKKEYRSKNVNICMLRLESIIILVWIPSFKGKIYIWIKLDCSILQISLKKIEYTDRFRWAAHGLAKQSLEWNRRALQERCLAERERVTIHSLFNQCIHSLKNSLILSSIHTFIYSFIHWIVLPQRL